MELPSKQSQNIDQPPSQTLPPQRVSSSPKPKLKLRLFLFLGILIIGFIGNYFMFGIQQQLTPKVSPTQPTVVPTTDPTSSWKTYIHSRYNYLIKYPPDWNVLGPRKNDPPDSANIRISYIGNTTTSQLLSDNQALIDIIIEPNPENKIPTKQWFLEERINNIPPGIDTSKYILQETTLAGLSALKVNDNEIFFAKDSNLFWINWLYTPGSYKIPPNQTINQILSTFKFLE